MTPILRKRLDTDYTAWSDCLFSGSASGTTLTVASVNFGTIANGAPLFWSGAPYSGPTIAYQNGGGTGGVGQYTLSAPLTLSQQAMAAGQLLITQPTEMTVQLDFHSATLFDASDMAATVTTLFQKAGSQPLAPLFNSAVTGVWPLYADDAKQVPFQNAEQQYETMWVLDCCLQVNQEVSWPQQFASSLFLNFIQADDILPPSSGSNAIGFFQIGIKPSRADTSFLNNHIFQPFTPLGSLIIWRRFPPRQLSRYCLVWSMLEAMRLFSMA